MNSYGCWNGPGTSHTSKAEIVPLHTDRISARFYNNFPFSIYSIDSLDLSTENATQKIPFKKSSMRTVNVTLLSNDWQLQNTSSSIQHNNKQEVTDARMGPQQKTQMNRCKSPWKHALFKFDDDERNLWIIRDITSVYLVIFCVQMALKTWITQSRLDLRKDENKREDE